MSDPEAKCNGTHDGPPCGDPECWAREDPPGLSSAIDIAGVIDPWPLAGIPAAPPAPADDVRAALERVGAIALSALETGSRDRDDWVDDMIEIKEAARRALSAQQEGGKT